LEQLRAEVPVFAAAYADVDRRYPQGAEKLKFNEALKHILDRLATDLIENTRRQAEAAGVETVEDVRRQQHRLAGFSTELAQENGSLKRFLHARLYSQPAIAEDRDRSVASLDALFQFLLEHPDRLPEHYAALAKREPPHRVVCDYIAGMTDHFLLRQCQELLGAPAGKAGLW
jgi:dGTPase